MIVLSSNFEPKPLRDGLSSLNGGGQEARNR